MLRFLRSAYLDLALIISNVLIWIYTNSIWALVMMGLSIITFIIVIGIYPNPWLLKLKKHLEGDYNEHW